MRKRHLTSIRREAKMLALLFTMLAAATQLSAQGMFTIKSRVVDALMRNELPGATI